MWYCAFCGRYHTRLTPAYGFDGWKRPGKTKARDKLCMKGLFYTVLMIKLKGTKMSGSEGLKDYSTVELVKELEKREGVEKVVAGPYEQKNVEFEGPAVVLVVID